MNPQAIRSGECRPTAPATRIRETSIRVFDPGASQHRSCLTRCAVNAGHPPMSWRPAAHRCGRHGPGSMKNTDTKRGCGVRPCLNASVRAGPQQTRNPPWARSVRQPSGDWALRRSWIRRWLSGKGVASGAARTMPAWRRISSDVIVRCEHERRGRLDVEDQVIEDGAAREMEELGWLARWPSAAVVQAEAANHPRAAAVKSRGGERRGRRRARERGRCGSRRRAQANH
jgi:hypothetical protein